MERRKFLIGAGSTTIGASAIVGSGAFTSTEMDRVASIEVADDPDALLGLEPCDGPNGDYALLEEDTRGREKLEIRIDPDNPNIIGEGVNPQSDTWICCIFTVKNQGTQPVEVGFNTGGGSLRSNARWLWSADDSVVDESNPRPAETQTDTPCGTVYRLGTPGQASLPTIASGEDFTVNLRINTEDDFSGSTSGKVESITIRADAVED
ncbi:hypothetical protein GS429_01865 [Natronorubrum sp. JWXQ-INN-674]|uniref:DUF1102 domain-containing protein n=1 Tax=Natronorubrum halalkaliphilum TaxID=2691917 RepID=A0A6B0VIR6_9EURY|nr:hypothetical protein [Natronorubrum halalkaliphilum]MXV60836.1 hypothetical protein [Natronorubrum halalkaliphilum]